jgi:hypothetical protein
MEEAEATVKCISVSNLPQGNLLRWNFMEARPGGCPPKTALLGGDIFSWTLAFKEDQGSVTQDSGGKLWEEGARDVNTISALSQEYQTQPALGP